MACTRVLSCRWMAVMSKPAHAGDRVQSLNVEGAGNREQDGVGSDWDIGNEGVSKDVLKGNLGAAHAFSLCQSNVVLVQLVHHVTAHPHVRFDAIPPSDIDRVGRIQVLGSLGWYNIGILSKLVSPS